MKSLMIVAMLGMAAMATAAHAEPGGRYGRFKIYDIGNPGYVAEMTDCMDMPCCKNMKVEDMKNMDCADMPCCKTKMEQGACKKMLKAKKK